MGAAKISRIFVLVGVAAITTACDGGPKSGRGFTLPEGDPVEGEAAFKRFQCADCHSVAGRADLRDSVEPSMTVMLGGETTIIKTYGQLVTSVINPSHRISQRYMKTYGALTRRRSHSARLTRRFCRRTSLRLHTPRGRRRRVIRPIPV